MSIFDAFKSKKKIEVTDADLEAVYGGEYLDAKTFQTLSKRVADLDDRVDWLTILGGSSSGRLSGSIVGQPVQCRLRPLQNKRVEGLAFTSTILPVPPAQSANAITAMMPNINDLIFAPTGSAIEAASGLVHFTTIILKGPAGYTDAKLRCLTDMNVEVGNEAIRALISVHQGHTTPNGALREFAAAFSSYMLELQGEVRSAYEWAADARAVRV